MFDFHQLAAKFGGQTEPLRKGVEPYREVEVSDMVKKIEEAIEDAITALRGYQFDQQEGKRILPQSRMVRLVRNGIAVKVGYGAKNETIRFPGEANADVGIPEQNFQDRDKAISYLESISSAISQGNANDRLAAMLESYRARAEKGKAKRTENAASRRAEEEQRKAKIQAEKQQTYRLAA